MRVQTAEYRALMARLRRDEEQRSYESMTGTGGSSSNLFSKEDVTSNAQMMREINQQLTLIFNFLVSIFGVAATLFVVARWWDAPWRVLLALAGAAVVGVAEVVVYSGYASRLGNKEKEKETREVVRQWVVGNEGDSVEVQERAGATVAETERAGPELRRRAVPGGELVDEPGLAASAQASVPTSQAAKGIVT